MDPESRKLIIAHLTACVNDKGVNLADMADGMVVAIGGSVSYGFADAQSDLDVIVIVPKSMRENLSGLTSTKCDFKAEGQNGHFLVESHESYFIDTVTCSVETLFEQNHLIPLIDRCSAVQNRKQEIGGLSEDWWLSKRLCCWSSYHDTYGRLKQSVSRGFFLNTDILWGTLVRQTLQMACLMDHKLYPREHWLERAFRDCSMSTRLTDMISSHRLRGNECVERVKELTRALTDELRNRQLVPKNRLE